MNPARIFTQLAFTFLLSLSLPILGLIFWPGQPAQADSPPAATPVTANGTVTGQADTTAPVFTTPVLLTPADGLTLTTAWPAFDWADATDTESGVISYTLALTGPTAADNQAITTTGSSYTPTLPLANGFYTWTVQAHDAAGNASDFVSPYTFTLEVSTWLVYLPVVVKPEPAPTCPTSSSATFNLIPIQGSPADHPDYLHGDFNLSLRGYNATSAFLGLVSYNGSTDANAPQLAGLFEPNRFPGVSSVYRVNSWNWACGPHGCPGPAINTFPVTLAGLTTTPGEAISIPERSPNIYSGSFKAMVLYAEERRITLGYTREDTVANGYAVHIENVCVDPNLLALYRSQITSDGWRKTGQLPALRNNQPFGTALDTEILVAIRDRGSFMDPRSRKDWWMGY